MNQVSRAEENSHTQPPATITKWHHNLQHSLPKSTHLVPCSSSSLPPSPDAFFLPFVSPPPTSSTPLLVSFVPLYVALPLVSSPLLPFSSPPVSYFPPPPSFSSLLLPSFFRLPFVVLPSSRRWRWRCCFECGEAPLDIALDNNSYQSSKKHFARYG